jgi:hypothetical protein
MFCLNSSDSVECFVSTVPTVWNVLWTFEQFRQCGMFCLNSSDSVECFV